MVYWIIWGRLIRINGKIKELVQRIFWILGSMWRNSKVNYHKMAKNVVIWTTLGKLWDSFCFQIFCSHLLYFISIYFYFLRFYQEYDNDNHWMDLVDISVLIQPNNLWIHTEHFHSTNNNNNNGHLEFTYLKNINDWLACHFLYYSCPVVYMAGVSLDLEPIWSSSLI